jgi:hypothetical protein
MGKARLRGSGEEEIVWFTVEVKRESSENESGDLAGMMQRRLKGPDSCSSGTSRDWKIFPINRIHRYTRFIP